MEEEEVLACVSILDDVVVVVVVVVDVEVVTVVAHLACKRVSLCSGIAGSRLPLHGQSFSGLESAQTSICVRISVPPHSSPSVLAHPPHSSV